MYATFDMFICLGECCSFYNFNFNIHNFNIININELNDLFNILFHPNLFLSDYRVIFNNSIKYSVDPINNYQNYHSAAGGSGAFQGQMPYNGIFFPKLSPVFSSI